MQNNYSPSLLDGTSSGALVSSDHTRESVLLIAPGFIQVNERSSVVDGAPSSAVKSSPCSLGLLASHRAGTCFVVACTENVACASLARSLTSIDMVGKPLTFAIHAARTFSAVAFFFFEKKSRICIRIAHSMNSSNAITGRPRFSSPLELLGIVLPRLDGLR